MKVDKEVEDDFIGHWQKIIIDKDGNIDLDQVKKELFDFSTLISNVMEVYPIVTFGTVSKPLTYPKHIIHYFNDGVSKRVYDSVKDDREIIRDLVIHHLELCNVSQGLIHDIQQIFDDFEDELIN